MNDKRRLFLTLALSAAGLLVILAVIAVIVIIKVIVPALREHVVSEARSHGIELGFSDVEISWNHLSIQQARFRLVGVRGLAGTADRIDVTLSDFEPTRINLESLHLELLGSFPSLIVEATEWTKNYSKAYALPLSARPVSARWRGSENEAPWVSVTGGQVGRTLDGGSFQASGADAMGVALGSVGTRWTKKSGSVQLGLGQPDLERAPVLVNVDLSGDLPSATVKLTPTPIEELAEPLAVKLPMEGVIVSSEATLQFLDPHGAGSITGTLDVILDGYIPPHPRELDGFLFGSKTTFASNFRVSADKKQIDLTDTRVKAGAFQVKGHGQAQRHPDHARLRLDLVGYLSCADIAGAAAETHLGRVLSQLPKTIAKQTLQGSVGVTIKVDADTRDIENAKVLRLIGIGCGLKPLELPTPQQLEAFAKELPGFVGELPSLADRLGVADGFLPKESATAFKPPSFPLPNIEFNQPAPAGSAKGSER